MSLKKKRILTLAAALILVCVAVLLAVKFLTPPDIYINEICPTNDGSIEAVNKVVDKNGEYCDWIEIYNNEGRDISLSDFVLKKNKDESYVLGDFTIKAHDFIIVYCSKNGFDDENICHADFSIGKADEDNYRLCYGYKDYESVNTSVIDKGYSISRNENGDMYISNPTPLAENDDTVIGATPVFSVDSGMYADSFTLEIYAGEGQKIYYTLDGTDPEKSDSRILYESSIEISDRSDDENVLSAYDTSKIQLDYKPENIHLPETDDVDKGTVIRACAQGSDGKYGKTVTGTYFVGVSNEDHSDLPIISVVTDPDNLYNEQTGIYCLGDVYTDYASRNEIYYNGSIPANYNQSGREWEKECYIEYFDENGNLTLSQDAGMRIQGGWSRADYQKSFRFYARSDYGKNTFDYAFWDDTNTEGETLDSFKTFVLRNGGNDCNYSKFKDTMIQSLVSNRNVETQSGKACVLFIDGEYWGLYTLQEDYSTQLLADKYGVNKSDIAIYKNDDLDTGTMDDKSDFAQLRTFIVQNDLSIDENYKKVCAQLDVDNFADYIAIECYIYNNDWPQNNYACWRTRTVIPDNEYSDGRWRFYLFDTESSMYHYNTNIDEKTTFEYLASKNNTILGSIIKGLLANEDFRQKFITALMDLKNINFEKAHFNTILNDYKNIYFDELAKYFARFPTWAGIKNATEPMIERMKSFVEKRPSQICEMLENEYDLSPPRTIKVSCDDYRQGVVTLDNYTLTESFSGTYYDGCEITLTAEAKDGYVFTGWEGIDSDDTTITVKISGNMEITATYEKSILY